MFYKIISKLKDSLYEYFNMHRASKTATDTIQMLSSCDNELLDQASLNSISYYKSEIINIESWKNSWMDKVQKVRNEADQAYLHRVIEGKHNEILLKVNLLLEDLYEEDEKLYDCLYDIQVIAIKELKFDTYSKDYKIINEKGLEEIINSTKYFYELKRGFFEYCFEEKQCHISHFIFSVVALKEGFKTELLKDPIIDKDTLICLQE